MNINQRAKETLWWIYNYYSSRDQDYEASKAVENAQELNQSDANTLYYIGDSYIYRCQYDKALTMYKKARKISQNPEKLGDEDILFKIACCYSLVDNKNMR